MPVDGFAALPPQHRIGPNRAHPTHQAREYCFEIKAYLAGIVHENVGNLS